MKSPLLFVLKCTTLATEQIPSFFVSKIVESRSRDIFQAIEEEPIAVEEAMVAESAVEVEAAKPSKKKKKEGKKVCWLER